MKRLFSRVSGFGLFPALVLAATGALLLSACKDDLPSGLTQEEVGTGVRLVNFDATGKPLVRFDVDGNQVDSHGGEIEKFGDTYYWYGETYGCGFEWLKQAESPFCGFRVYTSQNLTDWTDRGLLFDVSGWEPWQARCHWFSNGCFRPHVAYNSATNRYVLWINVYDKPVGYYVLEATSPLGPFVERGTPRLALNMDAQEKRINNGDHNLFVDDDGTGYLIYTDWVKGGDVVIERLTPDFLNGTGEYVRLKSVHSEAPTLFKRNGRYYAMISSPPNDAYAVASTTYYSAPSALGPWSRPRKISPKSCGGQPFHVSQLPTASGNGYWYLYLSDLWINSDGKSMGDANQAPAAMFWAPLSFTESGEIEPIECRSSFYVDAWTAVPPNPDPPASRLQCDINARQSREFRVTAGEAGQLRSVSVPVYQRGEPDAPLRIEVRTRDGRVLRSTQIERNAEHWQIPPNIAWAARKLHVPVDEAIGAGETVSVRLSSDAGRGCYGFAFQDRVAAPKVESWVRHTRLDTWLIETRREPRVELDLR